MINACRQQTLLILLGFLSFPYVEIQLFFYRYWPIISWARLLCEKKLMLTKSV